MRKGVTARTPDDDELLAELRQLLAARGRLTASLIEASDITRAPISYIRRFGSLMSAYARIGYRVSERQRKASERFRAQNELKGSGRNKPSALGRPNRPQPSD